jgi:hypothetical protein
MTPKAHEPSPQGLERDLLAHDRDLAPVALVPQREVDDGALLTLDEVQRLVEGEPTGRPAVDPDDDVAPPHTRFARGAVQRRRDDEAGTRGLDRQPNARVVPRGAALEGVVLDRCQKVRVRIAELAEHSIDRLLVQDFARDRPVIRPRERVPHLVDDPLRASC